MFERHGGSPSRLLGLFLLSSHTVWMSLYILWGRLQLVSTCLVLPGLILLPVRARPPTSLPERHGCCTLPAAGAAGCSSSARRCQAAQSPPHTRWQTHTAPTANCCVAACG